jgi:hypothetical protein
MQTPRRRLKKSDLARASKSKPEDFGNARLYELCRRYPTHSKVEHTVAKVWLIGRAYSAALERGVGPAADLYVKAGRAMRNSSLDGLLRRLPDGRSPIAERLARAVEVHWQLTEVWRKVAAKSKRSLNKRSLASKYLHFHYRNVFPIYDNRAERAIAMVTPRPKRLPELQTRSGDTRYRIFCQRYLWLLRHVRRRFGVRLTLREADRLLLAIADNG